jgi:hypothetical protein
MSASFASQFGSKLINASDSTEVAPADALSGKDQVSTHENHLDPYYI